MTPSNPQSLAEFLAKIQQTPESVEFEDTIAVIDALYDFTPSAFDNGEVHNAAGQNNGSCRILAFAQAQGLSESHALACFGRYYRDDVLKHPQNQDHANIREFMRKGWSGLRWHGAPLAPRKP